MKLHGIAMVRNEADVIEVFVRHNLTVLDGLTIVDHGSVDATPAILAALVEEGLPIEVTAETSLEFLQSDVVSSEARRILANSETDFIFLLDADEFLKVPSRPRLEEALASLSPDMHAVQEWHTYVPDFSQPLDPVALIRSARKVVPVRATLYKAVVSRHFLDSPTLIAEGNHWVQKRPDARAYPDVRHARLLPEESAVAHVPIRSAAQFSAKIAIGWLACLMQPGRHPLLSYHWRKAYRDLRAGGTLTPERLTRLAATYGVPDGEQSAEGFDFIDEPFLADISVAHAGAARADPFVLLLQFAERLAQRLASAAAATPATQAEPKREQSGSSARS
jgi:hypothetical protein